MGEVPLRAFELPPFQTSHRVRAQIVWPSTSRCQSRPNAGKAPHDRVPPAEAGIQGSAVQTAHTRLSLLQSVCHSGPLRAGSTEGVAFLGIAVGGPGALCSTCPGMCGLSIARKPLRQWRRAERRASTLFSHFVWIARLSSCTVETERVCQRVSTRGAWCAHLSVIKYRRVSPESCVFVHMNTRIKYIHYSARDSTSEL